MWVLGAGIMLGGLLGAVFAGIGPGLVVMAIGAGLVFLTSWHAEQEWR